MNDETILHLLQTEPEAGCRALLSEYGGLIRSMLRRLLSREPDIEECAADVLTAVWQQAGKLAARGTSLRAWIIVLARNTAASRLRSQYRRSEVTLDEALHLPAAQSGSDLEDAAEDLVLAMPQPDREIFLRKYWLMESSEQIGCALGLTAQNVNTRLYRGRKAMRRALKDQKTIRWEDTAHE